MTSGLTCPRLIVGRDEDGHSVDLVVKLRDPGTSEGHARGTSLAAELIFGIIGRAVGLSVPEYGVAEIGSIFADAVRDSDVHQIVSRNIGPNFATVFLPRQLPWDASCTKLSLDLRQAIDDVLTFDATIVNGDRKATKPNLLWDGNETVHVIDHGLACPVYDWSPEEVAESPLFPDREIRGHAGFPYLRGKRCSFQELHGRWSAAISEPFWADVRAAIPPSWERRAGDLDRIFQFLMARSERFREIGLDLRGVVQ